MTGTTDWWIPTLAMALFLPGCGAEAGDAGGGTGPADLEPRAEAIAVMGIIRESAVGIDFQELLVNAEGQTILGASGELVVTALRWEFNAFSPDGDLVFTGALNIGILNQPRTMQGELTISGGKEARVEVDMTIDGQPDEGNEGDIDFDFGGTITYNGSEFQVADVLEATEPSAGDEGIDADE